MTPWTPSQCRAFVRRMYRIDHLLTAAEASAVVGLSHDRFMGHARRLGVGRFLFGKVRFTASEVERLRNRPDRRRLISSNDGVMI